MWVRPRILDPFCIVTYYMKWVKTSWTYSMLLYFFYFLYCLCLRNTISTYLHEILCILKNCFSMYIVYTKHCRWHGLSVFQCHFYIYITLYTLCLYICLMFQFGSRCYLFKCCLLRFNEKVTKTDWRHRHSIGDKI